MKLVTVLFARADSVYKTFPFVDVWDAERDALKWAGGTPVVAHPPCAQWGLLRNFARFDPAEKEMALFAVSQVRKYGGILEHPRGSLLWKAAGLPLPGGAPDAFGGFTVSVAQFWWGHKANKATWLYMVGINPLALSIPFVPGEPKYVVETKKRSGRRPAITKREREATPVLFAKWLVESATVAAQ